MAALLLLSMLGNVATAAHLKPFTISDIDAHQANGYQDNQGGNYYSVQLNVTSANGDSPKSAFCFAQWPDNGLNSDDIYSNQVPTGYWINCAQDEYDYDDSIPSEFAMQLFNPFSIGSFSVAIQQKFTQTSNGKKSQYIATSEPYRITNTSATSPPTQCSIEPYDNQYQHAGGDCDTAANFTGYVVSAGVTGCTAALSFSIQDRTKYGDNVFVVGNITALGNWSPTAAVALNTTKAAFPVWSGGNVLVEAGTPFQYKFIQWDNNGTLLWETGPNRVGKVWAGNCGTQSFGKASDVFRRGKA